MPASSVSEPLGRGRLLAGRYLLGDVLGSGGMADVYDALDQRLDRRVAVKVLRPGLAVDPVARERFASEARSAACLSHPNVVCVFDSGEDGDVPWLVMERLPGRTLADELAAGPVAAGDLRSWTVQVLAALGAAHDAGIVHRDIKPGNILITDDGRAKLADFGIAKAVEPAQADVDLTSAGTLLGTPAYLAPERIDGAPASVRSDLYAVGVVLWESLVGRSPFEGSTPMAVAARVRYEMVPAVRDLRPEADPELADAADRALAKEPLQRPASADELAAIVTGAASVPVPGADTIVMDVGPPEPQTFWPAPAPAVASPQRPPLAWAAVGVALGLLALIAAGLLVAYFSEEETSAAGVATEGGAVAALRATADRLERADEPAGADVAGRVRSVADLVAAGSPRAGAEATIIRDDLPAKVAAKALGPTSAADVDNALGAVPGVGPPPTTTTTSAAPAPTTAAPAPAPKPESRGGMGERKGKDEDD